MAMLVRRERSGWSRMLKLKGFSYFINEIEEIMLRIENHAIYEKNCND